MKRAIVHVIGAGVSGLSAALHLATGRACDIVVHEASPQAGGRRRSFYDEALQLTIDSGNFPLLSCHTHAQALIARIGARGEWREADRPGVEFADLANGERWSLRPNEGRVPWWIFDARRRAPRTKPADYWAARRLLRADERASVADVTPKNGAIFERLWRPLTLAALNAEPAQASARLAGGALREFLDAGGRGARASLPINGFGRAFVEPALRSLCRDGATIRFERELRALDLVGERVVGLEFEHDRVDLSPIDRVVLATPPDIAAILVPGLQTPRGFNGMIAVHFSCPPAKGAPMIVGVVNGAFDWLFNYADRLSVTIKDAGARLEAPRDDVAKACWRDVAALTGLSDARPAWRVVALRRASFLVTPQEEARRPPPQSRWRNLVLAGAYVRGGHADSIEGAVRSGGDAAQLTLEALRSG